MKKDLLLWLIKDDMRIAAQSISSSVSQTRTEKLCIVAKVWMIDIRIQKYSRKYVHFTWKGLVCYIEDKIFSFPDDTDWLTIQNSSLYFARHFDVNILFMYSGEYDTEGCLSKLTHRGQVNIRTSVKQGNSRHWFRHVACSVLIIV